MNVLILNYEYPPLGGGAGNANFYLLRELATYPDMSFQVVTSAIGAVYEKTQPWPNVTLHRLPIGKTSATLHFQSNRDLIVYFWRAWRFLPQLFREQKFDLIHAFFTVPCGFLAYLWRRHAPYIVSLRGSDVPGHNPKFNRVYKLLAPLFRRTWAAAAAVVANSVDLRATALKFRPRQAIEVIPNGVDVQRFQPLPGRFSEQGHSDVQLPARTDDVFRLLYVGRLNAIKGLTYLMEAFADWHRQLPRTELVLIGGGPMQVELQRLRTEMGLEQHVKILGVSEQSAIIEWYQRADVLVLPSLNEGMSNVLLEGLACGLPIIATDTGGIQTFVTPDNGIIVPKRDAGVLVQAFQRLYDQSAGGRRIMGEKSLQQALSMSWDKVARSYFTIYKRVCAA